VEIIARFLDSARSKNARVVLPDGHDDAVLVAARRLADERIARPILLGTVAQLTEAAARNHLTLDGLQVIDPAVSPRTEAYAEAYVRHRHVEEAVARRLVHTPLVYGGMMLVQGDADAMVGGALHATATVIEAAAVTVGYEAGLRTASSFFLMILPSYGGRNDVPLIYADCAVNVQPTAEQLADIALATEATARRLLDEPPRVALLSFSTVGSGPHPDAEKVRRALALVRQRRPDANVDGEFQADAALSARVAAKKLKRSSTVAGAANVLIFPDLDAGNIAYKLTQYLAGAVAIGPVLQGFAKPVSDLSRGASDDDVVAAVAICLTQLEA
jgi:phosphate acetyltransferase